MSGFDVGQRARVKPGRLFAGKVVTVRSLITDDPDEPLVIEAVFDRGEDRVFATVAGMDCTLLQDEMWFLPADLEAAP